MAGDLNVGLHGADSALEAFRNLTVNRDHNLGTLDVVKNDKGEVTELKCSNHHFWKFWANDSRSVTMASANELRSVFETAVDGELQKCFGRILKGDKARKTEGLTEGERDVLLGKMKEIKEHFHRAIFPEGCEEKAMSFTRKDICAIVQNVDKLVADNELSVNVLLAADVDDLCKMATSPEAGLGVKKIKNSAKDYGGFWRAGYYGSLAKEAMKSADATRILSASRPLVEHIFPQLSGCLLKKPPFQELFKEFGACRNGMYLSHRGLSDGMRPLADAMKKMINELRKVRWPAELNDKDVTKLTEAISDCDDVVQHWNRESDKFMTPDERKKFDEDFANNCDHYINKLEEKLNGLRDKVEANIDKLLAASNETLAENGISTVCFGHDGKLVLRESVELVGEELDKAVREDVASIIDDINSKGQLRSDLAEEGEDPEIGDSYDNRQSVVSMFNNDLVPVNEDVGGSQVRVGMDAVAGQMKQQIKSDSTVRFGVYAKPLPVGDEAKKFENISKHLAKFKTAYADVELGKGGRDKYETGHIDFDLEGVKKFVAKKYKGDNEIKVFLDVISWYSKDSPKLFHSNDEEKEVYRKFLEGVKREVESICGEGSGGCPEGKFKDKLESVMSSCLELSTGAETKAGFIYDLPEYYSDLAQVVDAVGEAMDVFMHSV